LHLLVQHGSRQGQHHRSGRHCQHRNDQHHNALSHPITSCFFHYIRLRSPLSSKKAPPKAALFCSAPRRGQAVIPQVLPGAEPHPPPPAPERRATRGGSTALRSCAGRQRNPAPAPAGGRQPGTRHHPRGCQTLPSADTPGGASPAPGPGRYGFHGGD
ncbi:xanthine dehydrogenase subunit XdhC, partial [Dysosmobacter welbionis]